MESCSLQCLDLAAVGILRAAPQRVRWLHAEGESWCSTGWDPVAWPNCVTLTGPATYCPLYTFHLLLSSLEKVILAGQKSHWATTHLEQKTLVSPSRGIIDILHWRVTFGSSSGTAWWLFRNTAKLCQASCVHQLELNHRQDRGENSWKRGVP